MNVDQLTEAYTIERLNAINVSDIAQLHAAVYGRTPEPGFFQKKYDTAFTGVKYIGYIAYSVQRMPIGYYGVIPCFIQIEDKIILAAQSADTMTHPQHRFKGLFVELASLTFQLCRDNGIQLLFGFPNQNSLPGFIKKLNWQTTETMEIFVIKTAMFSWTTIINKLSFLKRHYAGCLQKQLKKYKLLQHGISNSVFDEGFNGVYRNDDYLKYKTYGHTQTIKIGQAILWIKIGQVLLIGDITVLPTDFEDMMNEIKKLANKLGIKQIHFHTSPGTSLHKLFSNHFIGIPSFPVIFMELSGSLLLDKIKFTGADIDTF